MRSPDMEQKRRGRGANAIGYSAAVLAVALGGLIALRIVNPSSSAGTETIVQKPNLTDPDTKPNLQGITSPVPVDPRIPVSEALAIKIRPLEKQLSNLPNNSEMGLFDCSNVLTNYGGVYYPGLVALVNPNNPSNKRGMELTTKPGSAGDAVGPTIPKSDAFYFTAFVKEKGWGSEIISAVTPTAIDRDYIINGLYFGIVESASGRERNYRASLLTGDYQQCNETDWATRYGSNTDQRVK